MLNVIEENGYGKGEILYNGFLVNENDLCGYKVQQRNAPTFIPYSK